MNAKRCLACHGIINTESRCPKCGSTEYIITDKAGSRILARSLCKIHKTDVSKTVLMKEFEKTKSWKDEYRKSMLHEIEICIIGYSYEFKGGSVVKKAETSIKICGADELFYDKITWFNQKFARIDTNETQELAVSILKKGNGLKKQKLYFEVPNLKEFWKIGIKLEDGLRIRFVIGNDTVHTMTECMDIM